MSADVAIGQLLDELELIFKDLVNIILITLGYPRSFG
jgi:hypothetical protein